MEEDDMVKSRVGNTPSTETNRWGRKGCKPKGSYKEVPRPSQGLALAAAKRSLTVQAFKIVVVIHKVNLTEAAINPSQMYLPNHRFLVKDKIMNILESLL